MDMQTDVVAVILAAGQGTRMKSAVPKILHLVADRPMVDYVVQAALAAGASRTVVVVGRDREQVDAHLRARFGGDVATVVQEPQRGTGDAVRCALPALETARGAVLVLYGDTPRVPPEELRRLLAARRDARAPLGMLTCKLDDPRGYGRVVRDETGRVCFVREDRDATEAERALHEVNPGMYAIDAEFLRRSIGRLQSNNAQGELYLTDLVELAAKESTVAWVEAEAEPLAGINDRAQLEAAEQAMYRLIAERWRKEGVTIRAGACIGADVELAADALVDHGAVLRGRTKVGAGARIGVGAVLADVEVATGAWVKPYSVCERSFIGPRAQVGPFAHLRPESHLDEDSHIGNFVEAKKTHLGRGAKANHLAYLGDGEIGAEANVGAGTIFCNYDGFQKNRTVIGARAFIGSDSQLVAPVTVGEGAYVATGTTVTMDVPADALAIARPRQENKEGYAIRMRAKLAARAKPKG